MSRIPKSKALNILLPWESQLSRRIRLHTTRLILGHHTSPTLYPSNTVVSDNISDLSTNSNNNNNDDNDSSADDSIVYNLQSLLSIAKSMFFKNAENKDLFDYDFCTTTDIYNNIIKQLPRLPKFITVSRFGKLIKDKDFGERVSKRVEGKIIKGRMLYKLKDNAIGNLVESTSAFCKEVNNR